MPLQSVGMEITMNNKKISTIMKSVSKPGRYSGGEYNQIIKDKDKFYDFIYCYKGEKQNLSKYEVLFGKDNFENVVFYEYSFAICSA